MVGTFERALDWLVDHKFEISDHTIRDVSFIVTFLDYSDKEMMASILNIIIKGAKRSY